MPCMLDKQGYRHAIRLGYILSLARQNGYANASQCYVYTYTACLVSSYAVHLMKEMEPISESSLKNLG